MGSADVIPGVSGGTIALITGIYEDLIRALKSIDATMVKKTLDFDLKGEQMARDYGIRFYAAPKTVGDNPSDYDVKSLAHWFVEQLQAIPEGTTSLVLDNATWVEAGLGYLVAMLDRELGDAVEVLRVYLAQPGRDPISGRIVSATRHIQQRRSSATFHRQLEHSQR